MVDLKPSLASYARVSYARELNGDPPGATQAMRLALDAAAGDRERPPGRRCSSASSIGARKGRDRRRLYRSALAVFPGYVYALDALAPVRPREGRLVVRSPSSAGPPTRSRCRSSSHSSATCYERRAGRAATPAPVRDGHGRSSACSSQTGSRPISRRRSLPGRPRHRAGADGAAGPAARADSSVDPR